MSKRDDLEPQARELYVIYGVSKRDIAARLGVSERSVHNWSKDDKDGKGTWDTQKAALTSSADTFHAELMSLGADITRKIKDDLLDGRLDKNQVATLGRIVKTALDAWKYQQKNPPKRGPATPEQRRAELNEKIRERLGLKA